LARKLCAQGRRDQTRSHHRPQDFYRKFTFIRGRLLPFFGAGIAAPRTSQDGFGPP
jgi:hypothetical protein